MNSVIEFQRVMGKLVEIERRMLRLGLRGEVDALKTNVLFPLMTEIIESGIDYNLFEKVALNNIIKLETMSKPRKILSDMVYGWWLFFKTEKGESRLALISRDIKPPSSETIDMVVSASIHSNKEKINENV